jgi:hypothetical protein
VTRLGSGKALATYAKAWLFPFVPNDGRQIVAIEKTRSGG